jgi:hypothetical protein
MISFAIHSKYHDMLEITEPLAFETLIEKSLELVQLIVVPFKLTPFHVISAATGNVLSSL